MRVKNWLRTVPTLVIIGSVLFLVLSVGSGLLLWGSGFAHNMVHNQLSEQQIKFPPKGSPGLDPKEFPGLQRYAGQAVDSGPKAKAYADQFIKVHLKGIADGQTYSQVSALAQANPNDTKLAGAGRRRCSAARRCAACCSTRGVGRSSVRSRTWSGSRALLGAIAVLLALALGFFAHERQIKHAVADRDDRRGDGTGQPVASASDPSVLPSTIEIRGDHRAVVHPQRP